MRLIDRLQKFVDFKNLSPHAFELECRISNGYISKQTKGKGGIGGEILLKIGEKFKELNLMWVLTGEGEMISPPPSNKNGLPVLEMQEGEHVYLSSRQEIIQLLKEKIVLLEGTIADKDKIIAMLEGSIKISGVVD